MTTLTLHPEHKSSLLAVRLKLLQTHLNPHFLFNALGAVQAVIADGNRIAALKHVASFAQVLRCFLNQMEKDTLPLYDEVQTLQHYFHLQKLRYGEALCFHLVSPSNSEINQFRLPVLLLLPLIESFIENSVHRGQERLGLNIIFRTAKERLYITIQYSGNSCIPSLETWRAYVELLNEICSSQIRYRLKSGVRQDNHLLILSIPRCLV